MGRRFDSFMEGWNLPRRTHTPSPDWYKWGGLALALLALLAALSKK